LGISIYTHIRFIPLGIYGLNLIPAMVWVGDVVNGASRTIIIKWGIAKKYNGIDLGTLIQSLI
jgi:hypothetical protein